MVKIHAIDEVDALRSWFISYSYWNVPRLYKSVTVFWNQHRRVRHSVRGEKERTR
jgi:hypothetical protein